jgi:hypothetical protein
VVGRKFDIWADDRLIMRAGEFVLGGAGFSLRRPRRPPLKPMIPALRERFNAAFTPEKYAAFLARLEAQSGTPQAFRHSETPCFFPAPLIEPWRATAPI